MVFVLTFGPILDKWLNYFTNRLTAIRDPPYWKSGGKSFTKTGKESSEGLGRNYFKNGAQEDSISEESEGSCLYHEYFIRSCLAYRKLVLRALCCFERLTARRIEYGKYGEKLRLLVQDSSDRRFGSREDMYSVPVC